MSWTRITKPRQTGYQVGRRGWIAGYDKEGVWRQSAARILPASQTWLRLDNGDVVHHPITHYSPFLAPSPPPKLPTLLETVQAFCQDAPDTYHRETSVYVAMIDAKEREEEK